MIDIEKRANLCLDHGRKYFRNILKQEFARENFENYFETVYFVKEMRRMKHYLVFIAFGSHLICLLARLVLFDWTSNGNSICSPSIPIQLNWFAIVSITVSVLILTQAYGGKIKTLKYYYCTTFFAYEFVWIYSIFTYVYLRVKIFYDSAGKSVEQSLSTDLVFLFYAMAAGYTICSHWAKNTCVHLSLCRREIFAIEPKRTQYDVVGHGISFPWYELLSSSEILLLIWTVISIGVDSGPFELVFSMFYLMFIFASTWNCVYSIFIKKHFEIFANFSIGILLMVMLLREIYSDFVCITDFILCWICCLSIGRQWFLDIEIDPEKYAEHFKTKLFALVFYGTRNEYDKYFKEVTDYLEST